MQIHRCKNVFLLVGTTVVSRLDFLPRCIGFSALMEPKQMINKKVVKHLRTRICRRRNMFKVQEDAPRSEIAINFGIERLLAGIRLVVDGEPRDNNIEGAFVRYSL